MKRKAETIQTVLAWYAQYGYDVAAVQAVPKERLRQELLALKGIGEETADVPETDKVYADYHSGCCWSMASTTARSGHSVTRVRSGRCVHGRCRKKENGKNGHLHALVGAYTLENILKQPCTSINLYAEYFLFFAYIEIQI
ncbi:MAG: hypothetical protein SPL39_02780 [Selenomonadaceae bacterium]|nr:hypothetical protein [Selenomonadaceae bacterium]